MGQTPHSTERILVTHILSWSTYYCMFYLFIYVLFYNYGCLCYRHWEKNKTYAVLQTLVSCVRLYWRCLLT